MFAGMPDFNQSLEMMKTMWGNISNNPDGGPLGGFNMPGGGANNPFGMPTMDVEELDKRIQELKNVENWLTLNLNVLKTTIQGLEVQRATLGALHAFSESMKTAGTENQANPGPEKATADTSPSPSGMAVDMMNSMAKSMTQAMSAITEPSKPVAKKKTTTASKTAKSRQSRARASTSRRAKGN